MKKLFFLGALFAAAIGFTACSSDKDSVAEGTNPNENGGGNYLAISINLPTVSNPNMTRAEDNDDNADDNNGQVTYKDGLDTEWAVNDATLLIFKATSQTFVAAYDLTPSFQRQTTQENVTSYSQKFVQQVSGDVAANDLMLVVLNKNSLFTYAGNTITVNGTTFSSTNTYSDFQSALATTAALNEDAMHSAAGGFYMANAPLADKVGSTATALTGANVRVLVPITATYPTEASATAANADQIYVERGMAKVTVESSTGDYSNSKVNGAATITWTAADWTLDNTNKESYLVRSTDGHSDFLSLKSNGTITTAPVYRYIGNAQISYPSNQTFGYRTYFAKSANYDSKIGKLNRVTGASDFKAAFGDENPQYCFENTFPVAGQNVNNTTLVQISTTTTTGGTATDLYTLNGNKSYIYLEAGIKGVIASAAAQYLIDHKADYVTTGLEGKIKSSEIAVTLDASVDAGTITATAITVTGDTKDALKTDAYTTSGTSPDFVYTLLSTITSAVNTAVGEVVKYKGGKSYYHIRIKHFGDNLTPWNNTETPAPGTGSIYPATNGDNNYLGRYGVLRNNWYNLKIKSIRALGEPTPVTDDWPGTPDDELDSYITFQINVLSWAKRPTQAQDL